MLPGSIFATEGARAMGDAGRMPHGHKEVAGLQIAYVARDALTAHLRCPVFGRITTLNRKKGGGKAERGAALVHNIFHVPERPDIMALAITWLVGILARTSSQSTTRSLNFLKATRRSPTRPTKPWPATSAYSTRRGAN